MRTSTGRQEIIQSLSIGQILGRKTESPVIVIRTEQVVDSDTQAQDMSPNHVSRVRIIVFGSRRRNADLLRSPIGRAA